MELTYTMQGDYLIPDLTVPESPKIGKYGMLRRTFLREHRDGIYTGMLLEGTLNSHLEEVDAQANRMMDKLTEQMKTLNGVTEQMKSEDQKLTFVRLRNALMSWKSWAVDLLDLYVADMKTEASYILSDKYDVSVRTVQRWKEAFEEFVKNFFEKL